MENKELIITPPGGGEHIRIAGSLYRIILSGEQTDGKTAIIEMNVPPNSGPVPHEHPGFQESFYIAEGEVEFRTKSGTYLAQQGAIVTIPLYGPVHAFKNVSDKMAKLICIVSPAGLDAFFRIFGKPANDTTPPKPPTDEQRQLIMQKAEEYGQKLYPPDYFDK
jgi:quercetin dioxygenase-like cupin family protein